MTFFKRYIALILIFLVISFFVEYPSAVSAQNIRCIYA